MHHTQLVLPRSERQFPFHSELKEPVWIYMLRNSSCTELFFRAGAFLCIGMVHLHGYCLDSRDSEVKQPSSPWNLPQNRHK